MDIESRRMHVTRQAVAELACGMLFVRTFVAAEPHVAVNPEHGAATGARIGNELFGDFLEVGRHRRDEIRHLSLDRAAKPLLVGFEPGALIVGLEVLEEPEERRRDTAELGHGFVPDLNKGTTERSAGSLA